MACNDIDNDINYNLYKLYEFMKHIMIYIYHFCQAHHIMLVIIYLLWQHFDELSIGTKK